MNIIRIFAYIMILFNGAGLFIAITTNIIKKDAEYSFLYRIFFDGVGFLCNIILWVLILAVLVSISRRKNEDAVNPNK